MLKNLSEMSKAELLKFISTQTKGDLTVKLNSAGGVYIRSNMFREYSQVKDKEYVAGINVPFNTAMTLFNSPDLIEAIKIELNKLKGIK